jgi:hypothetical protein
MGGLIWLDLRHQPEAEMRIVRSSESSKELSEHNRYKQQKCKKNTK